jgi:hypothetical protein
VRLCGWFVSVTFGRPFVTVANRAAGGPAGEHVRASACVILNMLKEHLALPFSMRMLGVDVTVDGVDLTDYRVVVAICTRRRARQSVPLVELSLPKSTPSRFESCRPDSGPGHDSLHTAGSDEPHGISSNLGLRGWRDFPASGHRRRVGQAGRRRRSVSASRLRANPTAPRG